MAGDRLDLKSQIPLSKTEFGEMLRRGRGGGGGELVKEVNLAWGSREEEGVLLSREIDDG